MPVGLVDFSTHDEFEMGNRKWIQPQKLIAAIGQAGHKNVKVRW